MCSKGWRSHLWKELESGGASLVNCGQRWGEFDALQWCAGWRGGKGPTTSYPSPFLQPNTTSSNSMLSQGEEGEAMEMRGGGGAGM